MLATGLRSRFFVTILAVLMAVTTRSIFIYTIFLRQERLKLIDQQVRETAAALVDSQLGDLRKIDFEEADDIISEELGESRIGKFFIIRNSHGETIFESASAKLLPITEIPSDRKWFEISKNGRFIRGLNLSLPRIPDRTLQVGLVLDEGIWDPGYFSGASFTFIVVVFLLGLVVSLILTSFLLRPIAMLDKFLTGVTSASRRQSLIPEIPDAVFRSPRATSRDEFERVIAGLNALISKVNKNYEFSRLWAYQMAHELKTPLSLANLEIERLQKRLKLNSTELKEINFENQKISETINSFLGWAELENSTQQKHLYMNRLSKTVREVILRLQDEAKRLVLIIEDDPVVPANPQHLEQLVQNLILNAVSHSGGGPVDVRLCEFALQVSDSGPGIPKDVLDRLGEPFNKGDATDLKRKGHGLGLAWVVSICRLYGWELSFKNLNPGARALIHFGSDVSHK